LKNVILVTLLIFSACFLSTCTPKENVSFISKVQVTPIDNGVFQLNERIVVDVDGKLITIPSGFVTDFASIPRVFWAVDSPFDIKTITPSILHDYMYGCPNGYSREKIDSIFHSALIDNLVNPVKAYAYWLAVRIGGHSYFNKDNHCAVESKEYNQKVSP